MSAYTEHQALAAAIEVARKSPCAKSKRGVVIWHRAQFGPVVGSVNSPPHPMKCDGSEACRQNCNKLCVHAEAQALVQFSGGFMRRFMRRDDYEMIHVKVVNNKAVPSGPPSCWQCSRLILSAGIRAMWLLHEDGLRSYTPEEFHRLTLQHCNLPVISH